LLQIILIMTRLLNYIILINKIRLYKAKRHAPGDASVCRKRLVTRNLPYKNEVGNNNTLLITNL